MKAARKFVVMASMPERLRPLLAIAYNLWWSWNPEAIALFQRLDYDLWAQLHHNPIELLGVLPQERLQKLLEDDVFLSHMDRVYAELRRYMEQTTWYDKVHGEMLRSRIAYFAAEFGIHECLRLYSGGLGILSGDHLKSASDLGLPLTGIGLLYKHGYFSQYLNQDGWQQEDLPANDFFHIPVSVELREDNTPYTIELEYPGRIVHAQIWRVQVGRAPLFLLDTNIESNSPADREITSQLYGGDLEMRIKQEILLGIGGIRALDALGLTPTVCHMNEGHSAFLALERIRLLQRRHGLSFDEAREVSGATNVFTTHTPVPAGNDRFPPDLVRTYFSRYAQELGISVNQLIDLGRQRPGDNDEPFCMTVLALRLAAYTNGVSELHGHVSRKMWMKVWPGVPAHEIPITHITNGIHTRSWYSDEIARLYERYLGPRWSEDAVNQQIWERVANIPDSELWRSHERLRERLVAYARRRLRKQLARRGAHRSIVRMAEEVLDPEILTIGFARRMASYKRANLILRDPERLVRLLNDPQRPVQIIFAGKAHPKDHPGKEIIRQIIQTCARPEFRRRMVFIEDYDIRIARYLVQGVDVWLNSPRRPMEASGTSGMKAPVNGGINLSILDGWWCEAYRGDNGWAIGAGEEYEDHELQDEIEGQALYEILEKEVVPLFYNRGADNLPREWIAMMKASIMTVCPVFNTNRMVEEYTERFYLPCMLQWNWLSAENWAATRELAQWRRFIRENWSQVRVLGIEADGRRSLVVGDTLPVRATVALGPIPPEHVSVELYYGATDTSGAIERGQSIVMHHEGNADGGAHIFTGHVPCTATGEYGYTVRVLPYNRGLSNRFDSGLIHWFG